MRFDLNTSNWGKMRSDLSVLAMKIRESFSGSRLVAIGCLGVLLGSIATSQTPTESASSSPITEGTPFPAVMPNVPQVGASKTGTAVQLAVSADMIGFSHVDGSGTQIITLVHTGKSWMAVYHVDRTGTIRLVSSRPIDADFSLQLNATSPLPDEIRSLGGKSR
jgi:hypothetical protein